MKKALLIAAVLFLQSGIAQAANWRSDAVKVILKYGKELGFHASSTLIFEFLKEYLWTAKEESGKGDGTKQGSITAEDARRLHELLQKMLNDRNYLANLNPDLVAYLQNWQRCTQAIDLDLMIGSCTAVIRVANDTNDNLAIAFNNRGFSYYRKREYGRSIQDYNQAIQLNSRLKPAYNNRGVAFAETKQYDRAGKDFDETIRLAPNDALGFYNRGHVYDDLGQYDHAIQYYDRAIRINPSYVDAFVNRGMAYSDKGQYDVAIQDFNRAIQIDPSYALAYVNRGLAHNKKMEFDSAFKDWDRAFQIDPKFACSLLLQSRLNLSSYLQSRGCTIK